MTRSAGRLSLGRYKKVSNSLPLNPSALAASGDCSSKTKTARVSPLPVHFFQSISSILSILIGHFTRFSTGDANFVAVEGPGPQLKQVLLLDPAPAFRKHLILHLAS